MNRFLIKAGNCFSGEFVQTLINLAFYTENSQPACIHRITYTAVLSSVIAISGEYIAMTEERTADIRGPMLDSTGSLRVVPNVVSSYSDAAIHASEPANVLG